MKSFKDLHLRSQLTLLTVTVSVIALLAAFSLVITRDMQSFEDRRFEQLKNITDLIAFNGEAALEFSDSVAADDLLAGLESQKFVDEAALFTTDGKQLALYARAGKHKELGGHDQYAHGQYVTEDSLLLVSPIYIDGQERGKFFIFSNRDDLTQAIYSNLKLLLVVLLACIALASVLALLFQKSISAPLNALLGTVSQIATSGDYSSRVTKDRENEFGALADNFNSMLNEIEERDQNLEQTVASRTAELVNRERILANIVSGDELSAVLHKLAEVVEGEWENAFCSIFLLNEQGTELKNIASPGLPMALSELVRSIPVGAGACGRAIELREPVIVDDIAADKICGEMGQYFCSFGLNACWSLPILDSDKEPLGTLSMFFKEKDAPSQLDLEKVSTFVNLASLVIEHRKKELQLRLERDRAQEAATAKGHFLANMSHEIRTPMNGVLGMADLLADTGLTPQQLDMLTTIQSSGRHLLGIINDVLDFSKISEGKMELSLAPTNLLQVGREIERLFESHAKEKNITFINTFEERLSKPVLADDVRLKQVLVNLTGNALKFTPPGGAVVLLIEVLSTEKGKASFRFSVSDSGVGISEQNLAKIFEEFSQADGSVTREFGGTGLGLSISRQLVGLMGGELKVQSMLGSGSNFFFELTFDYAEQQSVQQAPEEVQDSEQEVPASKILVAEDNAVNQKLIVRLLEKMGHDVTLTQDGAQAVKAFAEDDFDFVLLDIQMPVMGGEEALKLIRKSEGGQDIPILALTAHAMSGDRERYLEAGMDGYVSKPIDKKKLQAEMLRTLSQKTKNS